MKKLGILFVFVLIILLSYSISYSIDVDIAWFFPDPASLTGYKVYRTIDQGVYDFNNPVSIIEPATIMKATDTNLNDGTYFWIIKGFLNYVPAPGLDPIYLETELSNEVKAILKTSITGRPTNAVIESVKININLQ